MRTRLLAIASLVLCAGCGAEDASPPASHADGGEPTDGWMAELDAGTVPTIDSGARADSGMVAESVAPAGTIVGEQSAIDGDVAVAVTMGLPAVVRIEAEPDEHITFFLSFAQIDADVELELLRWDGSEPTSLGMTDAGPGLRTLAIYDPGGRRTFWARITTPMGTPVAATLTVTRVPFEDAATCAADCAHLLQLPLPNDVALDGYTPRSGTVFRYQYGRRDLVMFIRHAGQRMSALGLDPIVPADLSQWNGETPGNDVGSPRHVSHQRGKDVDISLYGLDGLSTWRSYCTTEITSDGRECIAGTIHDYDGTANALLFGDFFATGSVTMSFLDQELHPTTIVGADDAVTAGALDVSLLPLYSDGMHLQHWPNHDNHIHIRVAEEATTGLAPSTEPEAIEPP